MKHVCGIKGRAGEVCRDPDACGPPVPDARDVLEAFKKQHGIKSDDLARSLMFIENFAPIPERENSVLSAEIIAKIIASLLATAICALGVYLLWRQ